MENTLENKPKFFALYWGQKVLRCKTFNATTGNGLSGLMNVDVNSETIKENWFLELTPLSQISDEDAIEVYKIILGEDTSSTKDDMIFYGKGFCREYDTDNENLEFSQTYWEIRNVIDFLRSRGYALPWMWISVETLVEWGWVKLKSND